MNKTKQLNVLHLPSNVSGSAYGLSRGERSLGLQSDALRKYPTLYNFQFPCDIDLAHHQKGFFQRFYSASKAFIKYRNKYDIFHFNLGSSFFGSSLNPTKLGFLDLPFYPRKAKLFVTFNGCEARQKMKIMKMKPICACREENCQNNYCSSLKVDRHNAKSIKTLSKYVNHMWAISPDLLHFLPKEKSSLLPCPVFKFDQDISFPKFEKKLKIIHAPSNRVCKGTKYILFAMERLLKTYPEYIDFQLVENITHQKALELYSLADIVIDQILIGWYGTLAVEVMLMGKPVIARIDQEDLRFVPKEMAKQLNQTIINAHPYNIYEVIERCIHNRTFLKERSLNSLEYARRWHNPKYLASLTKEKYEA